MRLPSHFTSSLIVKSLFQFVFCMINFLLVFFTGIIMSPEEAAAFVKECEEKFANRYTEKDPEYARVCKTLTTGSVPPLIPHRPSNNDYSIN